jgi:hypothetical protein
MRIPIVARHLFLLLVVASPALMLAQFQQPTTEELKMTADPKAPGAAAVYFNIEEISNDPYHYQSYYARIKVLTEKGKDLATVELPYFSTNFRIADIKARTIHPDGTIIPLVGKPEDLLISKTNFKNGDSLQFNQKVFTLPSVEVGSILEYRYEVHYDKDSFISPTWQVQHPYFVHKSHYVFTPFEAFRTGIVNQTSSYLVKNGHVLNNLIWWPILPNNTPVKADAAGVYDPKFPL